MDPLPVPRHEPDVLVIGAGMVGLCAAYFLRRAGLRVTVLERGLVGGPQSCSSGNTGFVGTQGAAPLAEPGVTGQGLRWLLSRRSPFAVRPRPDPALLAWLWRFRQRCTAAAAAEAFAVLVEMKRRGLAILTDLCAAPGLAGLLATDGMLVACRTEAGWAKVRGTVPAAVAAGVPLRELTARDLAELEPAAAFQVAGALFNAEGATLRTPEFLVRFAAVLRAAGVDILESTEVTGFQAGGGTLRRVRTSAGDLAPAEVVLAAGVWSAPLARRLGLRLLLQPAKGYSVTVPAPRRPLRHPVLLHEGKVAILPLADRIRLGGTLELSGMDTRIAAGRIAGILATVESYLPGLTGDGAILHRWSGLRPCTPDSLPYLGRPAGYANLCVVTGHGHIGLGLAPVTGRMAAALVTGTPPELDLSPLRIDRFGRRAVPR